MKKNFISKIFFAFVCLLTTKQSFAQGQSPFIFTGQVRTRTEFRDGQGTLPERTSYPTVFTSQRTRLNFGYNADRFKVFTSIQDIRIWGMDASTISNLEGNKLFLHEGWGEIILNDSTWKDHKLSLKIGRQEIVYDDARLLGNLDWLQQARRHDAALVKYSKGTFVADIGLAFNQPREYKNTGTIYNGVPVSQVGVDGGNIAAPAGTNGIGQMYKSFQYLYLAKEIGFTKGSFLLFKDDFQKNIGTSSAPVYGRGVNSRVTLGVNLFSTILRKHKLDISAFYQGNKNRVGQTLDAYFGMLSTTFFVNRKFTTGPGVDYLSGNNTVNPSNVDHRFDPLYGTPHKFWGYMDYFYVADPYGLGGNPILNPGLITFYWKSKYKLRDNLLLSLDVHEFFAANKVVQIEYAPNGRPIVDSINFPASSNKALISGTSDTRLGTEIDFVVNYNLTKQLNIEAGYSVMFATDIMDKLKRGGSQGLGNAPATNPGGFFNLIDKRNIGHWAYLMVTFRPDFLKK